VVNDNGSHFINDTIEILTTEFMITHHTSITYYPQGNGQVKSTNKTLKRLIIKLVNANVTDWDVMLLTTLWAYISYNGKKLKPSTSQPKNQSLSFIAI